MSRRRISCALTTACMWQMATAQGLGNTKTKRPTKEIPTSWEHNIGTLPTG